VQNCPKLIHALRVIALLCLPGAVPVPVTMAMPFARSDRTRARCVTRSAATCVSVRRCAETSHAGKGYGGVWRSHTGYKAVTGRRNGREGMRRLGEGEGGERQGGRGGREGAVVNITV